MKKILFPTEFSEHAAEVFQYALHLAKTNNASISLVHALSIPLNPSESIEEIGNQALSTLKNFAEKHTPEEYKSVHINCVTEMGLPADVIISLSQEDDIDLVVMGMKGKTNMLEAFFGSVALDVVSRIEIPVFLVPSTNRFKPITNIAFAAELKMNDLVYMEQATRLTGKLKAKMSCVHFYEKRENHLSVDQTIAVLEDLFKHHPDYQEVTFFTNDKPFEKGIQDFVIEKEVDLLITQSHTRNWKFRYVDPSSSNRVARRINIPMLILK